MEGFALVLALAALPAAGNFLGGLAAEAPEVSERTLSLSLHLAAGIVLAVVGLELMPEALTADPPWVPIAAFVAGGVAFIGLERAIGYVQLRTGTSEESKGPLAIYSGVSIDLFSDGVMIGTGAVINPALGLLLALGQVPADIPEGFASVASLRWTKMTRRVRPWQSATCTGQPRNKGDDLARYWLRIPFGLRLENEKVCCGSDSEKGDDCDDLLLAVPRLVVGLRRLGHGGASWSEGPGEHRC